MLARQTGLVWLAVGRHSLCACPGSSWADENLSCQNEQRAPEALASVESISPMPGTSTHTKSAPFVILTGGGGRAEGKAKKIKSVGQ